MTPRTTPARHLAGFAALLAAAGLALAGCKSSTSGSASAATPSAATPSADSASTPASSASSAPAGSGGSTAGSTAVGASYFPIGAGNTWIYSTSISGGSNTGSTTNKITKVVPVTGGQQVTMSVRIDVAGHQASASKITYLFHPDGSITVPFTQFGGGSVKIKSGSVLWPSAADLASGRPHKSTLVFSVSEGGRTLQVSSHVTVKGGGSQSVTVPAGTYHAQVIDETFSEKVEGVAVDLRLRTWVANGVGPVKSALLTTSAGHSIPGTVEVLKTFTKG